jgi:hypothetical protein
MRYLILLARALRPSRAAWFVSALLALSLFAGNARAYHDEQTRSVEESAYIMRSGEWLLGPLQLGVGLWRFQLSTRTAPWILGAALGKFMPNLGADFMVLDRWGITLTLRGAFYYANSKNITDSNDLISVFIIPATLSASWRVNDAHTVSLHAKYVRVKASANAQEDDLTLEGGGLADNFQLEASWLARFTQVSALLMYVRYLPFQGDPIFQTTVPLDDHTTVNVDAKADVQSMQHSVAGGISGVFSWKHFNLRAGIAYGALFLPGPGLVLPLKYPYPDLTLYWRL